MIQKFCKIKRILSKKEKGDGGIIYAMCFVAFLSGILIFSFSNFLATTKVLAQTVEMKLHTIESQAVAYNQDPVIAAGEVDAGYRSAPVEQELSRMHIIRHVTRGNSLASNEEKEVRKLAKQILEWTVDEMGLSEADKATPVKGVLYEMTGGKENVSQFCLQGSKDAGSAEDAGVIIYEPFYNIKTEAKMEGGVPTGYFDVTYNIEGWKQYRIIYGYDNKTHKYNGNITIKAESNTGSGHFKLHNGKKLVNKAGESGATIEIYGRTHFWGLRNIFSQSAFGGDSVEGDNEWGFTEGVNSWADKGLVCVEATEIVPSLVDDRHKDTNINKPYFSS